MDAGACGPGDFFFGVGWGVELGFSRCFGDGLAGADACFGHVGELRCLGWLRGVRNRLVQGRGSRVAWAGRRWVRGQVG